MAQSAVELPGHHLTGADKASHHVLTEKLLFVSLICIDQPPTASNVSALRPFANWPAANLVGMQHASQADAPHVSVETQQALEMTCSRPRKLTIVRAPDVR